MLSNSNRVSSGEAFKVVEAEPMRTEQSEQPPTLFAINEQQGAKPEILDLSNGTNVVNNPGKCSSYQDGTCPKRANVESIKD